MQVLGTAMFIFSALPQRLGRSPVSHLSALITAVAHVQISRPGEVSAVLHPGWGALRPQMVQASPATGRHLLIGQAHMHRHGPCATRHLLLEVFSCPWLICMTALWFADPSAVF